MDLSPQEVRNTSFSTAKKGYDQSEVNTFISEVAAALEKAQNETTAMEARARAAVARLQELTSQSQSQAPESDGGGAPTTTTSTVKASPDDAETISRTLLLAQRTADQTVAEANEEAERILSTARADAASSLEQARKMADQLIEDAKKEARQAGEGERARVEAEVQSLMARRDFLESDVEHLEEFLLAQRERLREAAAEISDIVERVPGGLGEMRRPLLSAAGSDTDSSTGDGADAAVGVDTSEVASAPADDDTGELPIIAGTDDADQAADGTAPDDDQAPAGGTSADSGAPADPSLRASGRVPDGLPLDLDDTSASTGAGDGGDDTTPLGTPKPSTEPARDDPPQ